MFRLGIGFKRWWRPLTGIVAAYAVAAQSLLIVLGGFALPAHASDGPAAFELCIHEGQSAPDLPAGGSGQPGCNHCIFCFAGSHHAVVGGPPGLFQRIDVQIIAASWATYTRGVARLADHSIANPRGPPRLG